MTGTIAGGVSRYRTIEAPSTALGSIITYAVRATKAQASTSGEGIDVSTDEDELPRIGRALMLNHALDLVSSETTAGVFLAIGDDKETEL